MNRNAAVDLNLLRAFVAIYEARSLTGAASVLFITQPAVSQSLTRLRRELADDLFFRNGREMTPTPFAHELYPTIRESLAHIDDAVSTRGFDPRSSRRRFRIALSELGEIHWLAAIEQAIRAAGPGISIDVLPLDPPHLADLLTRGALDLAVNSAPVSDAFDTVTLKVEHYVMMFRARHPLAAARVDFDSYREADHVVVAGDSGRPNVERALESLGGAPEPRLRANHFSALPLILGQSDLVATVPRTLAEAWASTGEMAYRKLPFHVDPVEVRLYTRTAHSDAPALRWFRDTVLSAVLDTQQFGELPTIPPLR